MKSIFTNVINRGGYDLASLLKQIDRYHIEGKLTDEEREELYAMARKTPAVQYDYPSEIQKLWAAVRELQGRIQTGTETEPAEEWPEYVQPTGAHDAYQAGAEVTYKEQRYRCLMDHCVWAPDVLPSAWEFVSEEE